MMRIYTRTGDDGTTSLIGGKRVQKDDPRVEAYGSVDELNSWIGLIRSQSEASTEDPVLINIQNILFATGSTLATDKSKTDLSEKLPFSHEDILLLENEMDRVLDSLPVQTNFILPGGNNIISYCHIARTVCRRAERRVYSLSKITKIPAELLIYLNRLSDYLYVLSRKYADNKRVTEIPRKS
jgi:cob(I)alamin adenosyltransferase